MVGNVLPLAQIPEGTVVSNVEARPGDRGTFSRTSGAYAVIVAQVCVGIAYVFVRGGGDVDGLWGLVRGALDLGHHPLIFTTLRPRYHERSQQDEDRGTCKIRLPSGAKKTVSSQSRATVRAMPCAVHSFLPLF